MQETRVQSLVWEDPLEEGIATTPVFLLEKKHMNGGGLGAKVHGVPKSQDTTEVTSCIIH